MPVSAPLEPGAPDAETRAFVLRIRMNRGASGVSTVVTVDDVQHQRKSHFATLDLAFAEIRRALNQPGGASGQPH